MAGTSQPGSATQHQHLPEQPGQGFQMPLAEIADRAEVGPVQRRYCLKVEPLLAAAGNLPR